MKKIISQISLILIIMIIGITSVFITDASAASIAGINCPASVKKGENFNVSLILPSNAYAAESTITVKFSDGTTSTARLVYYNGMNDFPNRVTFNAKVEGTATITASAIIISDSAGNSVEKGGSKVQNINILSNAPVTKPDEPQNPQPPVEQDKPTNPGNNNGNSNNNNSNNDQVKFKDVNETVYATENCNIRKSYSTSSDKLGQVKKGTAIKRTGIADNGWSRIEYNGKVAYISSKYITSTEPKQEEVKITDVNETLYAAQNCNLRKSWSTDSDKAGYLTKGQEVTRTGVTDNGWSRIKYNNQEVFVATRLLSKEKPEETVENEVENNTVTNEIVEGEKTDLELIQSEIGVIPDVGNNIAVRMYFIVTLVAISLVCGGAYYINTNKKDKDV